MMTSPNPSPSPLTLPETALVTRLSDLADSLSATGQPGIAEELDRAAATIRELARCRALDRDEVARLRKELDGMRKAAVGVSVVVAGGGRIGNGQGNPRRNKPKGKGRAAG